MRCMRSMTCCTFAALHRLIDLAGRRVRAVHRRRAVEILALHGGQGHQPELFAHAVLRDHLAGQLRGALNVVGRARRGDAEDDLLGGLGICGRPFCCSKFLNDFQPVSTKMAKMQSMSLNPSKISGSCGRLMCCLRYEQEAYEELVKNVPKQGAFVETPTGYGIVTQVNLLRQLVKVKLDGEGEDTMRTYRAVEVATVPGGRPKDGEPLPSVLKYVPAPEPEEEPEDEWAIPEMIVSEPTEEKPENAKSILLPVMSGII